MNEQNKSKQKHEEAPKSAQGVPSAAKASSWKRLLSKKWVTPAAFMAAAAIIVTLMWVYQGPQQQDLPTQTSEFSGEEQQEGNEPIAVAPDEDTLEVTVGDEQLQWPVLNPKDVEVLMPFYDSNATHEERQAALVQYDNTFTPNMGIDLGGPSEESFDVIAALSGKVSHVEQHPLNGNVIEITHPGGYISIYQSLSDVQVKPGDEVKQGTLIAKSGTSELKKELGNHIHFELRQEGKAVNPLAVLP